MCAANAVCLQATSFMFGGLAFCGYDGCFFNVFKKLPFGLQHIFCLPISPYEVPASLAALLAGQRQLYPASRADLPTAVLTAMKQKEGRLRFFAEVRSITSSVTVCMPVQPHVRLWRRSEYAFVAYLRRVG